MIKAIDGTNIAECVNVIRESFLTVANELGFTEENRILRQWYEKMGFVHIGTEKFEFFPFTCGYMERDI